MNTNESTITTHAQFAAVNPAFRAACEFGQITPTRRQASKFRNRRGSAYGALLSFRNKGATMIGNLKFDIRKRDEEIANTQVLAGEIEGRIMSDQDVTDWDEVDLEAASQEDRDRLALLERDISLAQKTRRMLEDELTHLSRLAAAING